MEARMQGDTLFLPFVGELNSVNADQVEREIFDTLKKNTFTNLVLDFSKLTYVSSAGLRVVLKLKQKYSKVTIIEACLPVYDVLSMTGFTDIMEVHKALVKIDVSGAEIVGEGFFSTVYRIDKDTIVKVFNRTSDPNQIQRELNLAKQAFILGIPTAISYDIVRVGDKLGVRFEMLDCQSLKNIYQEHPERYEELTEKYITLLRTINTTETTDDRLPSMLEAYREKLERIKDIIGKDAYKKLVQLFKTIPNPRTFVHGDCHFKNIMVQNGELLLIDMDTLSYGDAIFEFAQIYAPYAAFDELEPGNSLQFFGLENSFCLKLFMDLMKGCLGKEDIAEDLIKVRILSYVHMIWWTLLNRPDQKRWFEEEKGRILELVDKVKDLKLTYGRE